MEIRYLILVLGIVLLTGLVSASTNIQSHPISEIDEFNRTGNEVNLTSGYNLNIQGNMTIWDKVNFRLGESIDNLVDGWLRITGGLLITEDLNVTKNIEGENLTLRDAGTISNSSTSYSLADFLYDSWTLNYTDYYPKTDIDTNLSLYILLTNQDFNQTNLANSINTSDNIKSLGFYDKAEVDTNLSLYIKTELDPIHDLNLSNNLISWWRMDDVNGGVTNFITTGKNGTTNDNAVQTNGVIGKAFDFDGNSDYIDIPDNPNVDSDLKNGFTISFWYKADNAAGFLISKFFGSSSQEGYYAHLTSTTFSFLLYEDDCTSLINPISQYSDHSTWTNAVVTYDETNIKIYLQGNLLNSTAYSGGVCDEGSTMRIGNHQAGITTNGFNGKIDDFRIYNRSLLQSEVTQLYELGDLDATTQLDRAYYKEYLATKFLYANFGTFINLFVNNLNVWSIIVGVMLDVNGDVNLGGITTMVGNVEITEGNLLVSGDGKNIVVDGGDVTIDGKLTVGGATDPPLYLADNVTREFILALYRNSIPPNKAGGKGYFYNGKTKQDEFFYATECRFTTKPIYQILDFKGALRNITGAEVTVEEINDEEPCYCTDYETKYRWNKYIGEVKSYQVCRDNSDIITRLNNSLKVNRTTGELEDKVLEQEIQNEDNCWVAEKDIMQIMDCIKGN